MMVYEHDSCELMIWSDECVFGDLIDISIEDIVIYAPRLLKYDSLTMTYIKWNSIKLETI